MVFSSITFLFIFLPVTFLLHCILPGIPAKNGLLIFASLFFYAYGEPIYVLLMIFSTFLNYLFGFLIGGLPALLQKPGCGRMSCSIWACWACSSTPIC